MSRSLLLSLSAASVLAFAAPALAHGFEGGDGYGAPLAAANVADAAAPADAADPADPAQGDDLEAPAAATAPASDAEADAAAAAPDAPQATDPEPVADAATAADDPWEGLNRRLYGINRTLDRAVLRPTVVFYHHATPTPVRHGLSHALSNLNEPIIFVNDVLQLRPTNAARSLGRFVLNSVVGVGGFIDVATKAGIPFHNADFGETLGRYGVPAGPYLFIPILGPSTVREASGRVVDGLADPFNSINYGEARDVLAPTRLVLGGLVARDEIDPILKDIDRTATDPYVTTRSLYLQNRRALVNGGASNVQSVQALPEFGPASPSPSRVRPAPSAQPTPPTR